MITTAVRFGEIEYDNTDIVFFSEGLVGMPDYKSFLILNHKEGSPFRWLQSLDAPELAFLIVDPAEFFVDYSPEITDAQIGSFEISEDTPRKVYAVVTVPHGKPESMTVNLAGPLLINAETRNAKQIVLDSEQFQTKHKLFAEQLTSVAA